MTSSNVENYNVDILRDHHAIYHSIKDTMWTNIKNTLFPNFFKISFLTMGKKSPYLCLFPQILSEYNITYLMVFL